MKRLLNTPKKRRAFVSPSSLSARQRANARYAIKKQYKEFISGLEIILENANDEDRKFFLDPLFEIPQIAERLAEDTSYSEDYTEEENEGSFSKDSSKFL